MVLLYGVLKVFLVSSYPEQSYYILYGIGNYTPTAAINGDIGWKPPSAKQLTYVLRQWKKLVLWEKSTFSWEYKTGQEFKCEFKQENLVFKSKENVNWL